MLVSVYDNEGNFVDDMTPEEFDAWCDEQDDTVDVEGIVVVSEDAGLDDDISFSGDYYDTEYGDCPPSHIYESGMYLGDGVWVSEDFFG
tara:strand:+ start:133 stop:399 length:267 start_codon:yes stop_codon:yes gene_type:complete